MTFAFYPVFFGVVGTFVFSGIAGVVFGAVLGLILAIAAVTLRRLGARWATSHTKDRVQEEVDMGSNKKLYPHPNMMLFVDIIYISVEVVVVSLISVELEISLYFSDFDKFHSLYAYYYYIDTLFDNYHALDMEIAAHVGTVYSNRVFIIKVISLSVITSTMYGIVIILVRSTVGWGKYLIYLSSIYRKTNIKTENRMLLVTFFVGPIALMTFYSMFANNFTSEYFLLVNSVPEPDWYIHTSSIVYIRSYASIPILLFLPLSTLISYLFYLYFIFRFSYLQRRK